jgi:hypothetical protein
VAAVERVAQWGGQMITAQWRCKACGSYFEALRDEFGDGVTTSASTDTEAEMP